MTVKCISTIATDYKNRVQVLQRCNIRLGSKLRNVLGKAGMEVLEGLMAGERMDKVVEKSGSKVLKESGRGC